MIMSQCTAQKIKFSIKVFFSKCDQIRSFQWVDMVTFTDEILYGKLHFWCSSGEWVAQNSFNIDIDVQPRSPQLSNMGNFTTRL